MPPCCRWLKFPGRGALVKEGTEVFDRLVCDPGAPCRSHDDPAVTSSVQQATRARRTARYQDRQYQLVAEKECRTAGPSPFLPRPALEDLLTAPLWPRHVFRKMPKTCRVAYRSLLMEVLWNFVSVDVEQPDACVRKSTHLGAPSPADCTQGKLVQEIWPLTPPL
jgi:hypothetical protein